MVADGNSDNFVFGSFDMVIFCDIDNAAAGFRARRRITKPARSRRVQTLLRCPRHESNMRTRFRKPLLYPLSYGGLRRRVAPAAGWHCQREARPVS